MDDILIFSTSLQEHLNAIREIFDVLEKKNFKVQIDKCNFLKKETEFLGHILTKHGIKPNPNKIKAIEQKGRLKVFFRYYGLLQKMYTRLCQSSTTNY